MSFLKGIGLGDVLGTISPGMGALTGKGLGADLLPALSPLMALMGGGGGHGGSSDSGRTSPQENPAAANFTTTGLGHALGVDPSRVAAIAGSIGKGMNGIAAGGGATPGYQAPELPAVTNHMQLLDPAILQAIIQHFQGGGGLSGGAAGPGIRSY